MRPSFHVLALVIGALVALGCAQPTTAAGASSSAMRASVKPLDLHGPFVGALRSGRSIRRALPTRGQPRAPAPPAGPVVSIVPGARRQGQLPLLSSFEVEAAMGARDPVVAAGPERLIISTSSRIAVYGKDGTPLQMLSTAEFFAPLKDDCNAAANLGAMGSRYPMNEFYDTRVIYDEHRGRFWIAALARNPATRNRSDQDKTYRRSKIVMAVSKTADPLGDWWLYWHDAVIDDGACNAPDQASATYLCPGTAFKPGQAADYPAIGISPQLFLVANFSHQSAIVNVIRADDLAGGTVRRGADGASGWHLWNFKNPNGKLATGILQPAVHHGRMQGDYAFLTSAEDNDTLVVWAVAAPPGSAGPLLFQRSVNVATFGRPVAAPQPPTAETPRPPTVDIGLMGAQMMKTAYRDGSLYTTWHDCKRYAGAAKCATAIRVARVDVRAFPGSARLTIDRTFGGRDADDPPGATSYYGWPVIEVNRNGDMVLGYNRSGQSVYPEARYGVHYAGGSEVLGFPLRRGETQLGDTDGDDDEDNKAVGRIDNSGISVDPSDDTSVWVIQPYSESASSGGKWRLVVGRVAP